MVLKLPLRFDAVYRRGTSRKKEVKCHQLTDIDIESKRHAVFDC